MKQPKWDYLPTGILRLEIVGECYELTFKDTKNNKIEYHLNELLMKMYKATDEIKKKRSDKIKIQKEIEYKRKLDAEILMLYKKRESYLLSTIKSFQEIKLFQEFLEQLQRIINDPITSKVQANKLNNILKWIEEYINRKNPFYNLEKFISEFN